MKRCHTDRIRKEAERHRPNGIGDDFERIFRAVGELAFWYSAYDEAKPPREIALSAIGDALEALPEKKGSVLRRYRADAGAADWDEAMRLFAEDIERLVGDFRNGREQR